MQSSKDYLVEFTEEASHLRFHAGSDEIAMGQMLTEHPDRDWMLFRIDNNERWPVFTHVSKRIHRP